MRNAPAILIVALAAACSPEAPKTLNGYVEADLIYLSPQDTGVVRDLAVKEGDHVSGGDVVFRLDTHRVAFSARQAKASADSAAARTSDTGMFAQQIAEAEVTASLARRTFSRSSSLLKEGVITKARFDADAASLRAAEARLSGIKAERDAALRDKDAAQAAAGLAERRLAEMETLAPAAGTIERVYRRAGEVVAAGEPVVALLAPDNLKIRFFVPEKLLASLTVGSPIIFTCDGCNDEAPAAVVFIATEPQFTPPVIYSIEERAKLVFLVEARPDKTAGLRPGQPVTIVMSEGALARD